MTAWSILQCLYLVAGGNIAPSIISLMFARNRAWGTFNEPVPAFIVVIGTILFWPILLLLITESER